MAGSKLNNLSEKQKAGMRHVLSAWKKSGKGTAVLEEGLMVLASNKRPTADAICRDGQPYIAVACTYGKGYRSKLALSKMDAALMLEFVRPARQAAKSEKDAKKMIEMCAGVILDGLKPPKTLSDPLWERVLKIIREVAPAASQVSLF